MSKTYSAGIVTAYGAAKRAGYQGTYEDFCRQQARYAESAAAVEQAKNTAVSAANTATAKAGEATTAATAAQTAKTQTEAAASQALTDISTARSGAISAVQAEGQTQTVNARAQAQAAATSATTASTKASEASASATSAGQSATNAAASATSAAQSASNAQDVLDSIPADYSDLSANVSQLKADLEEETNYIGVASKLTVNGTYKKHLSLKANHTYTFVNISGASVSIKLRSTPSGSDLQTVSSGLQVGNKITFLCNQDAEYIAGWCASETTLTILEEYSKIAQYNGYSENIQYLANGEYPVVWHVGGYVSSDGTINTNQYYTYSDLIDCSAIGRIRVLATGRLAYCYWYSADLSAVQAFVIPEGDNIISSPDGYKYCRISAPTNTLRGTKVFGANYIWANDVANDLADTNKTLSSIEEGNIISNALSFIEWEQGSINSSGEEVNSSYYIRSKYYYVGNLSGLSYVVATGMYVTWFTYDINYNPIELHPTWTGNSVIPINDNVAFIRLVVVGDQTQISPTDAPDIISVFGQNKYGLSIPQYWLPVLNTKINTIQGLQKTCGATGDEFIYITDYHDSVNGLYNCNNSPDMIDYIMRKTSARFVVFGGDGFDHESTISAYRDGQYRFYDKFGFLKTGQFYPVIGNHEWYSDLYTGTEEDAMTPEEVYNINYKRYESQFDGTDLYASYYFDNKAQKIRYYVLGCNYNSVITDAQIEWLFADLLTVPEGYSVFLITHSGVYRDNENPNVPVLNAWYQTIINGLDALKTGATITYNGNTYNFSGKSRLVICALSGHNHVDMSTASTQGIPIVNRGADTLSSANLEHVKGSTTEQAFDVVNIDMTNRKIYFTRIGAGNSGTFDF